LTGRFASTVPFYARFREPYAREFFTTVAGRLPLRPEMRLLDAGCGPGLLAIGFRPYVRECVGVDPEPLMLRAAREAARDAGLVIRWIEGRLEELPGDPGVFDVVTIGRALHWMDREAVLGVLDRVVTVDGVILNCGARTEPAPWLEPYESARRAWTTERQTPRYRIDHALWFEGSRFHVAGEIEVRHRHRVTVADLIGRALSKSNTSPDVLGGRRPEFEAALTAALEPFAVAGQLDEEIVSIATVTRAMPPG